MFESRGSEQSEDQHKKPSRARLIVGMSALSLVSAGAGLGIGLSLDTTQPTRYIYQTTHDQPHRSDSGRVSKPGLGEGSQQMPGTGDESPYIPSPNLGSAGVGSEEGPEDGSGPGVVPNQSQPGKGTGAGTGSSNTPGQPGENSPEPPIPPSM